MLKKIVAKLRAGEKPMNAGKGVFPVADYSFPVSQSAESSLADDQVKKWYSPLLVTASMIGERSLSGGVIRKVLEMLQLLEPDDYILALVKYYRAGLDRYGDQWRYSDITTALCAAAEFLKPRAYLEIGVRRGRSLAMVSRVQPDCHFYGFDYWKKNYAGMDNPGPEFVKKELERLGFRGQLELFSGDSHQTVPRFLQENPAIAFDLITVDGDHSLTGAADDLKNVLPRLKIGGALVFDDINHPLLPGLHDVWDFYTCDANRFSSWEFSELGYGVGIAIRKY